jgi:hypothetical protein
MQNKYTGTEDHIFFLLSRELSSGRGMQLLNEMGSDRAICFRNGVSNPVINIIARETITY